MEMKIDDAISSLRDRIRPPREGKLGNVLKVAAGTAATVWVVLQLRRELYGPGGSRMSRYDLEVDRKRHRALDAGKKSAQSDFVDAED